MVDVRVLLKLANFPQKRTTRPAKFFCVFLQARQDTHIALLQNGLAKSVHITLAGSIPSLPNVIFGAVIGFLVFLLVMAYGADAPAGQPRRADRR